MNKYKTYTHKYKTYQLLLLHSQCTVQVYSNDSSKFQQPVITNYDNLYVIIERTDDRQITINKKSTKVKPGNSILVRAYDEDKGIAKQKKVFSKAKFCGENYDKKKKNYSKCEGYEANRVASNNVYFEGKFRLPGASSKHALITYDHLPDDYWIYIPSVSICKGIPFPTILRKIKLNETIAFVILINQFQQSVIIETQRQSQSQSQIQTQTQTTNFKSSYSYKINEHSISTQQQQMVEPNLTDGEDETSLNEEQRKYRTTFGKNDSIQASEFCKQQNERFQNKSFKRTDKSISKKLKSAHKIIRQTKQRGLNKNKKDSRQAITWSAKAIFCAQKEKGDKTNKEAWKWCHENNIEVGKTYTFCHKWDKGSAYWLRLIAENGGDGTKLN